MATTFESGVLTIAATETAIGGAKELLWIRFMSTKHNRPIGIGATGITLINGYLLLPGKSELWGVCDRAEVFAIGKAGNKLRYAYAFTT